MDDPPALALGRGAAVWLAPHILAPPPHASPGGGGLCPGVLVGSWGLSVRSLGRMVLFLRHLGVSNGGSILGASQEPGYLGGVGLYPLPLPLGLSTYTTRFLGGGCGAGWVGDGAAPWWPRPLHLLFAWPPSNFTYTLDT